MMEDILANDFVTKYIRTMPKTSDLFDRQLSIQILLGKEVIRLTVYPAKIQ